MKLLHWFARLLGELNRKRPVEKKNCEWFVTEDDLP